MHRAVRLLIAATILIAGCGDDAATTSTSTTVSSTTTAPASTTAVTTDTTAPTTTMAITTTAADDGVVSITIAIGSAGLDLVVEDSPVEPGSRVVVGAGESVHVVFSGGVAEELHIHGYDLSLEIAPGGVEVLDFVADIPGIFEVELEGAGTLVFELEVS
ncbi:MAG: hypothetical protein HZA58_08685 [Acidimicrobiia bacterium]|nr:hypothetical protein [Acidimicrobiia bacterium]